MLYTDVIVIGGGIIGLATAYKLTQKGYTVVVLEKESKVAAHQSGRNSGVLHSGIYYKPGSLKATNCVAGKKMMEDFCEEHKIPYERCGKLIVAVNEQEITRLDALYERGIQNGIKCEFVKEEDIHRIEPYARGIKGIYLPDTGIVDYRKVCEELAKHITVVKIYSEVTYCANDGLYTVIVNGSCLYSSNYLINCAGLHSDRVAKMMMKEDLGIQIIPFRGNYYTLHPHAKHYCKGLIYPVPDPQFPFLGVHFTKTIDGEVECGPNALLALGREAYSGMNVRDIMEYIRYPGFWKLIWKHWKTGMHELLISCSKNHYVKDLQKLIPKIKVSDIKPRAPGIRAQAVNRDGTLVDDFVIKKQGRAVHVLNSPSPAATASLKIAEQIVQEMEKNE